MAIAINLENRHLFFLGVIIIAAAAVQLSLGATGTTPVNPGHPLSQTWIDTDLNMSSRNIVVNGGVINVSYPGAGNIPLTINGISAAGGYPIGTNKWFLAQGDPAGGIDGGRVWVQYGTSSAPVLVLEDYDDQPRIQFQQVGTGTEAAPQYSSWIGMARENSNDLAFIGGNLGIGTRFPARTLQINGNVLFNGTQEGLNTISIPNSDIDFGGGVDGIFSFRHTGNGVGNILFQRNNDPALLTLNVNTQKIGIGTTNPVAKLQISGDMTNNGARMLYVQGSSGGTLHTAAFVNPSNYGLVLGAEDADNFGSLDAMSFSNGVGSVPVNLILNRDSGNVGIGVQAPNAKLAVNGSVRLGSSTFPVQSNHVLCWRADKTIGYCSGSPDGTGTNDDGTCICNAIN